MRFYTRKYSLKEYNDHFRELGKPNKCAKNALAISPKDVPYDFSNPFSIARSSEYSDVKLFIYIEDRSGNWFVVRGGLLGVQDGTKYEHESMRMVQKRLIKEIQKLELSAV